MSDAALADSDIQLIEWRSTGAIICPGLTWEEWQERWASLDQTSRSINWLIGDYLAYAEDNWPEEWAQAIDPKYAHQKRGPLWVARRIPFSRRREKLSWSFHRELAALPETEQETWLTLAEKDPDTWTVQHLTEERNKAHKKVEPEPVTQSAGPGRPGDNGGPPLPNSLPEGLITQEREGATIRQDLKEIFDRNKPAGVMDPLLTAWEDFYVLVTEHTEPPEGVTEADIAQARQLLKL